MTDNDATSKSESLENAWFAPTSTLDSGVEMIVNSDPSL